MQDDGTEVAARHPMTHACRLAMPSADVSNIQARDAATQHNCPRLIHNQVASTAQSSVCMTRCPGGHLCCSQTLEKKAATAYGMLPEHCRQKCAKSANGNNQRDSQSLLQGYTQETAQHSSADSMPGKKRPLHTSASTRKKNSRP